MTDSPASPTPSPLETSSPDSITELFSRDPETWTDGDMDRMISHLRETRAKLGENQRPEKKAKPDKTPKVETQNVSADDLLKRMGLG